MDMDVAAATLAGSILFALSIIVMVACIVVINNILHKHWKPVHFFKFQDQPTYHFIDNEPK